MKYISVTCIFSIDLNSWFTGAEKAFQITLSRRKRGVGDGLRVDNRSEQTDKLVENTNGHTSH